MQLITLRSSHSHPMALHQQLLQLPFPLSSSKTLTLIPNNHLRHLHFHVLSKSSPSPSLPFSRLRCRRLRCAPAGKEETQLRAPDVDELQDASPEDLECVRQIQRVLKLLRKNRDMLFSENYVAKIVGVRRGRPIKRAIKNELFRKVKREATIECISEAAISRYVISKVKLTMLIEDPRDAERKRLLGIEDPDEATRDDLAAALEEVNEGRIPENRVALRLLAEEMLNWPNLEVEAPKTKPTRSLYAKATDTGIDPAEAARRLNIDWDTAAEIEDSDESTNMEVPPVVGYGALYLFTALPVIIGISVVLILFYNSLQ